MKDMTLINVILDRSGSMGSIAPEAVGMFNRFLDEQRTGPDEAELSLTQFDDVVEVIYTRKPIKDCPDLILGETYQPRGMTALLDAVGITITRVGNELNALPEDERPARVLFVVLTDGHENQSREYGATIINEMVRHQKEKYNWDFIFLAAGIDGKAEGAKLGLNASKCASFDRSSSGLIASGATMSAYTTAYRGTGDNTMAVQTP